MAIVDGSPNQTTNVTIDPRSVAQAFHEIQQQQAAAVPRETRVQKKIKSLLESGNVDKDNLAEITDITQKAIEDFKDELKTSSAPDMVKMTNGRYNDVVTDALDKYIEGDKPLETSAKLLEYNISEKLKKDSDFMYALNQGTVDRRKIANTAKEVVESFSKDVLGRDKPSKGPAITSGVSSIAASQAIENGPPAGSIDEIAEPHRRTAYHKFNSLLQRNGVSKEEATRRAFAMATKNYKKSGTAA
jgi:hypothetical protein